MRSASKHLLAISGVTLAGAALALGSALPAQAASSPFPGDYGYATGTVTIPKSFEHVDIPGSPSDWTVKAPAHTTFVEQDGLSIERAEKGKKFSDYSGYIVTDACSLAEDKKTFTCAMSATSDASLDKGDRLRISALVAVDDDAPAGQQTAATALPIASGNRASELDLTLKVRVGDPTPAAPTVTGITGEGDDRKVEGKAAPGASVDVVDSKGTAIGSAHVDEDGTWSVLTGNAAKGDLTVTQSVGDHTSKPASARSADASGSAGSGTPAGSVIAAVIGGLVILGGGAAALVIRTKRAVGRS